MIFQNFVLDCRCLSEEYYIYYDLAKRCFFWGVNFKVINKFTVDFTREEFALFSQKF